MLDLEDVMTDPQAEEDGVWVRYKGAEFRIARFSNPAMLAYSAAEKTRRCAIANRDTLDDKELEDLGVDAMARHVVKGWRDLVMGGAPFPYTPENARLLLTDLRFNGLSKWILMKAHDAELYRAKALRSVVGNSDGASSGSASTGGSDASSPSAPPEA